MIITDDTHAMMSQADFDALPEYSCSNPSGVFFGKRWKRGEPYRLPRTAWYMGEYIPAADPKLAGIRFLRILIV